MAANVFYFGEFNCNLINFSYNHRLILSYSGFYYQLNAFSLDFWYFVSFTTCLHDLGCFGTNWFYCGRGLRDRRHFVFVLLFRPPIWHSCYFCAAAQINPRPSAPNNFKQTNVNYLQFLSLNVLSAVHKAVLLHDLITYFGIDLLALKETWISSDDPPAIKTDVALLVSRAFMSIELHYSISSPLEAVYRHAIAVRPLVLNDCSPTSLEVQLAAATSSRWSFIFANIYRPACLFQAFFWRIWSTSWPASTLLARLTWVCMVISTVRQTA